MKDGISKIVIGAFLIFLMGGLSSCLKKFDPDSYAPKKSFGGFESSSDIEPDALVAYWAFDGSLVDSAGSLEAQNKGTTFDTAAVKGEALTVGPDHYVVFNDLGSVIPKLTSFTVSFWVNAPQNKDYGYGVFSIANSKDFWGNLDIYLDNGSTADSSVFAVHMNNANAGTPSQFMSKKLGKFWDQWVQVVITYDNSPSVSNNFKIYKDGVNVLSSSIKDGSQNYGPLKFQNATGMVIGTWQFETDPSLTTGTGPQDWAGSLTGKLDEFRIYKKPLSASEVNALYKLEKAGR